jgi:hypothetical protein
MNAFCRSAWAEDEEVRLVTHRDAWSLAAAAVTTSVLVARLVGGVFQEAGSGLVDLFRQIHLVKRLRHEPTFLLHRIGLSLGAREAATWTAVLDIARACGDVPVLRRLRRDSPPPRARAAWHAALWGIDRAWRASSRRRRRLPEMGYDFFVVADHGQVATGRSEEARGCRWRTGWPRAARAGRRRPGPEELARQIERFAR